MAAPIGTLRAAVWLLFLFVGGIDSQSMPAVLGGRDTADHPHQPHNATSAFTVPLDFDNPTSIIAAEDVPGCKIKPGALGCTVRGQLLAVPNASAEFVFTLPHSTERQEYRVIATLRTLSGDVDDMTLMSIDRHAPNEFLVNMTSTANDIIPYVELPASITRSRGGQRVKIHVKPTPTPQQPFFYYQLRVSLPLVSAMLHEQDMQVLQDIERVCCGQTAIDRAGHGNAGVWTGADNDRDGMRNYTICNKAIPAAAVSTHLAEEDLCSLTPNECDEDGHLVVLLLGYAGLACDGGLPRSLNRLKHLQILRLDGNDLDGQDINSIAEITGNMTYLQRLGLSHTNITGSRLPCEVLRESHGAPSGRGLRSLGVAGNEITGSLPDCFATSSSLEELVAFNVRIGGNFPDLVPTGSPLQFLNMGIARSFKYTPDEILIGPLPKSLLAAKYVAVINFNGHNFTGGVPKLSPSLRFLDVSNNLLDGEFELDLPNGLITILASGNLLSGRIPSLRNVAAAFLQRNRFEGLLPKLPKNLIAFSASDNFISGPLPAKLPPHLQTFNVSNNRLSGALPEKLPDTLQRFGLSNNSEVTGPIPWANYITSPSLLAMEMSNCGLTGPIELPRSDNTPGVPFQLPYFSNATEYMRALFNVTESVMRSRVDIQSRIAILDMSENFLEGPLPGFGALFPRAVIINFGGNKHLNGSLDDFVAWLASPESPTHLSYLNLSNLHLSGSLPEYLRRSSLFVRPDDISDTNETKQRYREEQMAIIRQRSLALNADRRIGAERDYTAGLTEVNTISDLYAVRIGLRRILDLSNAGLEGEFPLWLLSIVPKTARRCYCDLRILLGGNSFICPDNLYEWIANLSQEDGSTIKKAVQSGLECRERGQDGRIVDLSRSIPGEASSTSASRRAFIMHIGSLYAIASVAVLLVL